MTADLKQINAPNPTLCVSAQFSNHIGRTITALYLLTLVSVSLGTSFALYQNWAVRLADAHARLERSANMANFLVETALTSAATSLDNAQTAFAQALRTGPVSQDMAQKLINISYEKFHTYNRSDVFGLLFFIDAQGQLLAQSGDESESPIDFSDRYYFTQLRDYPSIKRTVGPMVLARTTGHWVFHMSVPVHHPDGSLAGVLVQQILENDIASQLKPYLDSQDFERMMTHVDGNTPSFVFPPPHSAEFDSASFLRGLIQPTAVPGFDPAHDTPPLVSNDMLIGFAKSPIYALETFAAYPLAKVQQAFWFGNRYLMIYAVSAILFVTGVFYYLHALSRQLSNFHNESLHDALTELHNRRALDEVLPTLLRSAMRSQEPISVLFIDIDHFRHFNEHFGHESGDIALQAVANTLVRCIRRPLDFVCRWGGEEFVVVLPQTDGNAAHQMAQNILGAIRAIQLQSDDGEQPRLTVSVGHVSATITQYPALVDLIDQADKAMLKAKSLGRNQSVEYVLGLQ